MARYTGADCKRCRREKTKLFLKGAKCDSPKCPIEIRPYPPGENGRNRPKESEFLLRVRESDIVEIAPKARELTPFIVARAEAGERPAPSWVEVIPDKMRVLVHTLPSRAQIDTLVQEQLIVEYYSK